MGESPYFSARRELYEEAGITKSRLFHLCDYVTYELDTHDSVNNKLAQPRNGMIFFAQVEEMLKLPRSEMKTVNLFDKLPEKLTYPEMMNWVINNLDFL